MHFNSVCNWNWCVVPWTVRMWRANLSNCNQRSHSSRTHHVRARTHTRSRSRKSFHSIWMPLLFSRQFHIESANVEFICGINQAPRSVCVCVRACFEFEFHFFSGIVRGVHTYVCVTEVFPPNFAGGKYSCSANAIREIEQNNKKRLLPRTHYTLLAHTTSISIEWVPKWNVQFPQYIGISHTSRDATRMSCNNRHVELDLPPLFTSAAARFYCRSTVCRRTPDARLPAAHAIHTGARCRDSSIWSTAMALAPGDLNNDFYVNFHFSSAYIRMIENLFLHSTRTIRAITLARVYTQLQCNPIGRYTNYVWMYLRAPSYTFFHPRENRTTTRRRRNRKMPISIQQCNVSEHLPLNVSVALDGAFACCSTATSSTITCNIWLIN